MGYRYGTHLMKYLGQTHLGQTNLGHSSERQLFDPSDIQIPWDDFWMSRKREW